MPFHVAGRTRTSAAGAGLRARDRLRVVGQHFLDRPLHVGAQRGAELGLGWKSGVIGGADE
ncbi:MAG TPA: hypothetical protein VGP44_04705, partial [Gemmatimonadales bacterium]|nr:hypothetical protein [Gemmatimonadales bacterium]